MENIQYLPKEYVINNTLGDTQNYPNKIITSNSKVKRLNMQSLTKLKR